jgi:TRAP-type C4-dicarboxylate transport system permease small subunit
MTNDTSTSPAEQPAVTPAEHTAHRIARRVGDWSGYIAETLGIIGLAIGIGLQLWDVLSRNLGFPSLDYPWVYDASSMGLIMGAFIYLAATRRHIGFAGLADLIRNEALRQRLQLVTKPIVAAMLLVLGYYGVELVRTQMQLGGAYSSAFYSPLWLFYAAFPITCILAAIRWLTADLKPPGAPPDEDAITLLQGSAE